LLIEYCNNNQQTTTKDTFLNPVKLLAILSALFLFSCGMQGDLYLPEEKADSQMQETDKK